MSRITRVAAWVALAVWSLPSSGSATAPAPAPSDSWSQTALSRIAAQEYRFSWHDGALSAPNRAHDLRARVSASGFSIVSRTKGEDAFALELQLARVGRGDSAVEAGPALVVEGGGRAELRRTEMTEWLKNGPEGVEHGLTLARPPVRREAPVVVCFRLGGSVLAYPEGNDGRSILFKDGRGAPVVRYGGLAVQDARGRSLPARMIVGPGELRFEIDDRDAVYPVTVDPLATSPQWDVSGHQNGAHFGSSVAPAGDVNADGYSDVLVAAETYDEGEADEGKVFLYLGGPSGLSTTPAWSAQTNQDGAHVCSVAPAGDVNGDGRPDIIVGSCFYDMVVGDTGAAFIWFGGVPGAGNLSGLGPDGTPANADWAVYGPQDRANLGWRVSRAGNVNGDSYDDVIVGAPGMIVDEYGDGEAFAFYGHSGGPSTNPDWEVSDPGTVPGEAQFGFSVAWVGDVNGDTFDDVIVGAPLRSQGIAQRGRILLYTGSLNGLSSTPAWTRDGDQESGYLGFAVAGVGDVNGDGIGDIVASSVLHDDLGYGDNGRLDLWFGQAGGNPVHSGWIYTAEQDYAQLGWSVGCAGDVNGDGLSDFVAGSDVWDGSYQDEGRAWVFFGRRGTIPAPDPSWTAEGGQPFAYMGSSSTGVGDVNGDGYADVLVGLYGFDDGNADSGAARLFLGGPSGLAATAGSSVSPGQAGADFGFSVAGAGDLNEDGYSDVIVGSPRYDNGQADEGAAFIYLGNQNGLMTTPATIVEGNQVGGGFGTSVAGAGDFDGDGRSDVIIGAPGFNSTSGAAWVYRGGGAGLTGERWAVGPAQAQAQLGHSVAGAGDVNGDGFADVVIGAYRWNRGTTDEGAAFVVYGSSTGPSGLTRIGPSLGSTFAHMGDVVASAGDVNGDGKSDVLVGMPEADCFSGGECGKVFLFMGSAPEINTAPASWSPEEAIAQRYFGSSVASAGDVNGDGFADVIVGEQGWSNNQTNEGRALVYLGPLDQFSGPSWTFESDQQMADLGRGPTSVASAGDVNNDGYSDVIVGATDWDQPSDDGKAWLFLGSASGLTSTPAWSAVGGNGASFGFSLAPAGDVNGDGYSDVVVGEYRFGINAGKAHIFYGNGGLGGRPHSSLQATPTHAVIAPLGITASDRRILVSHLGALPAGWDGVFLQIEVKPLTVPFDGTGMLAGTPVLVRGFLSDSRTTAALAGLTPFHWRVRVVGLKNPYFPRSPWFGLADTSRTLTDFRTPCFASRWYQDSDGDGHGNAAIFTDSCSAVAGSVTNSDDCDDANPARYPGNPEICDGIDNNCDALVDNAAAPTGSSQMTAGKSGLTAILSWSPVSGATSYDVVRGSLSVLRSFAGNYTASVNGCLANNTVGPTVSDTSVPPSGDAAWYLLRGVNCGGSGSYNEGLPSQVGSRDAGIAASSSACP